MKGETVIRPGSDPSLFGILHSPVVDNHDNLAFVFLNAGLIHRPGPFRLYVHLARALTRLGFTCLRIDQTGKGDSERRPGLDATAASLADVQAIADWFAASGKPRRLVLLGLCSGADDGLWVADARDDIAGLVTLDGFSGLTARFHVNQLTRKIRRVTPARVWRKVRSSLEKQANTSDGEDFDLVDIRNFPEESAAQALFTRLFDRGTHLFCVFTGDVGHYYNHADQLHTFIRDSRSREFITETFLPHARHTYPFPAHRDEVTNLIVEWCASTFGPRDTASAA